MAAGSEWGEAEAASDPRLHWLSRQLAAAFRGDGAAALHAFTGGEGFSAAAEALLEGRSKAVVLLHSRAGLRVAPADGPPPDRLAYFVSVRCWDGVWMCGCWRGGFGVERERERSEEVRC